MTTKLAAAVALAIAIGGAARAQAPQVQAQLPAADPRSWEAVTRQVTMPQWALRPGEGLFSFRNPLTNFYITFGGHAGISQSTTLRNVGTDPCTATALILGCDPNAPSGDLGTGGGGSFGVGARFTPMIRGAIMFTAEGGYTFAGHLPQAFGVFDEHINLPVRSFQTTANVYADLGGLLGTGRFNPYLMGGVGMAINQADDISFTARLVTGGPVTQLTIPGTGASQTRFMWTVGGGVQYQLTPSSTIELYYQYVDAGRFRTGALEGPGIVEEGNLRTHRIGAAISLNLSYLAQLVAGR